MKKVLIIEDDAIIGKIIQLKIEYAAAQNSIAVEVSRVFDGEEGLRAVAEKNPDLIVLDLMMPKKSGFEVLESMKNAGTKEGGAPHIMVLTNLSGEGHKDKVTELGASAYFIKSGTTIQQIADYVVTQLGATPAPIQ
ncbi:response regulator [Candidatus Azambacteria bacterium]|nr:response regulator [Candidatus Azambacteria bacterium]